MNFTYFEIFRNALPTSHTYHNSTRNQEQLRFVPQQPMCVLCRKNDKQYG